jgi:tetratricopeptide (TPR) repeat protein
MLVFPGGLLAILLPFLLQQGIVQDQVQAQFYEAMAAAASDGLPATISKLDAIASASPSSAFTPYLHQTIHFIALLHPGSVPDQSRRFQVLKSQVAGNPGLAKVLKRIEILQAYYAAAARGRPESASAALSDPVFEGSLLAVQALADAALRAHDYDKADALAQQIIEADPYSPLLANAHVILGISATYRGDAKAALRRFQHAFAVSPLPTIYGDTRDYLFAAYRFARPAPAAIGEIFDEVSAARLAGAAGLKEPQALIFNDGKFLLVDKEQTLMIAPEGKVLDTKAGRRLEDVAATGAGKSYALAEEGIDLGTGTLTALSLSVGGKQKVLKKFRSLAVDDRGDVYLLDQDMGLLRGSPTAAGALSLTALAPIKGRLIRIDSRGNLFVLGADGKSILVLSREGKQITSVTPAPTMGKEPSIEYFALDSLNHLYILDANSIQIFAMNDGSTGLDKVRVSTIPLDPRPQYKNLKVLGVTAAGEMVATGKNEDNWVYFR